MKSQNLRKDSEIQLKQYTTKNFRCYLIVSSTTYEIPLLCYARMKAQLVQGWSCNPKRLCNHINFFWLLRPFSKLLVSISFIYWLPISLEQKIFEVSFLYYFWPTQKFLFTNTKVFLKFSEVQFLLTVRKMTSQFGAQGPVQKCHPLFLSLRTDRH